MLDDLWNRVKALYAVETLHGYTEEEITWLKGKFGALPQVLEEYYRNAGGTQEFHCVQDEWILPEHFQRWKWLQQSEDLILLNENQGVCRAGIHREDLSLPNPPVYSTEDDQQWELCAPSVSDFLWAALAYEAVFQFAYGAEEFYWLTDRDVALLEEKLTEKTLAKLPFALSNWINGMSITLYYHKMDDMIAVMDCGDGNPTMLYGAASEGSFYELQAILEGIGEAM